MNKYQLLPIDESYNKQMLPILEAATISAKGLNLYFDKSPDIFTIPRLKYSDNMHIGFFEGENLKGFASMGMYDAVMSGVNEKVFSFYNFYLLPEARGFHLPQMAIRYFISELKGRADFGISLTMKGNRRAESYIGRQDEDWMPPSRVIDELVVKSILLSFPKKNNTGFKVRNACPEDIPAITSLLKAEHLKRDFGLPFDEEIFIGSIKKKGLHIEDYFVATDRNGYIKGCCLAWDCSAFRRTRVMRFGIEFYPELAAYKTLGTFLNMAPFPAKGESFRELTITDYAVENRDPLILHALLCEIYRRNLNRKYHFMNFASCRSDSLLKASKGFWHRDIVSNIIFTSLDRERYSIQPRLPYIDIAFL